MNTLYRLTVACCLLTVSQISAFVQISVPQSYCDTKKTLLLYTSNSAQKLSAGTLQLTDQSASKIITPADIDPLPSLDAAEQIPAQDLSVVVPVEKEQTLRLDLGGDTSLVRVLVVLQEQVFEDDFFSGLEFDASTEQELKNNDIDGLSNDDLSTLVDEKNNLIEAAHQKKDNFREIVDQYIAYIRLVALISYYKTIEIVSRMCTR